MPRPAPKNSCITCRRRKIKCDGALPVCSNCRKAQKHCQQPDDKLKFVVHIAGPEFHETTPDISDPSRSSRNFQPIQITSQPRTGEGNAIEGQHDAKMLLDAESNVSKLPEQALRNPIIALLFRHYIDALAPWYDLNDSHGHFGTLVPRLALQNTILFKAIIAFAACHILKTSGEFQNLGSCYHASCIEDLLVVIKNVQAPSSGEHLAATCLLRSYEILNGNTRQQQHLLGAYSFATSEPIDLNQQGLSQVGTWNYLREEITMALECRRPVRFSPGFAFAHCADMPDDVCANEISHILARVINYCFDGSQASNPEVGVVMWQPLRDDVVKWQRDLPSSFEPFSRAEKPGNPFPVSEWLVRPWHVAAKQYCSVAELLLCLSKPEFILSERSGGQSERKEQIQKHALNVCGLAFTNDDVAARVNAFGPLSFCGRYLILKSYQEGLVNMIRRFSIPTGWPVHLIIQDLEAHWASDEFPSFTT